MSRMYPRKAIVVLVTCLALFAQACSSDSTAAPAQGAPPAQNETGGDQGADLVLPDICEMLSAEEVLSFAGGSLRNEPTSSYYGINFRGCSYDFTAEDGSYDYYIVYAEPANFIMAGDVSGDPVDDLGDFAVLRYEESEGQYRLEATQGSLGIEVIGTRSDVAVEIARRLMKLLGQ